MTGMAHRSEAFKARRRERRHAKAREDIAREAAAVSLLRAAGHACRDCNHMKSHFPFGPTCTLDNEGPFFTPVHLAHACSRWEGRNV